MAYAVASRRREIGIRLALGASGRGVVGAILGRGLALFGAGLALGLAAITLLPARRASRVDPLETLRVE